MIKLSSLTCYFKPNQKFITFNRSHFQTFLFAWLPSDVIMHKVYYDNPPLIPIEGISLETSNPT